MLGRMVGRALAHGPPASVWDPELLGCSARRTSPSSTWSAASRSGVSRGRRAASRSFFRAPPVAVEALAAAGVRAVWLANNHALDYGQTALLDTLHHLEAAGIAWAGAGRDIAQARRGAVVTVKDVRIGLVGLADHPADFAATASRPGIAWVGSDELAPRGPPGLGVWPRSSGSPRRATSWSSGRTGVRTCSSDPCPHHPVVARALIAAGASIVCGHSAHVAQPIGLIDGGSDLLRPRRFARRLRDRSGPAERPWRARAVQTRRTTRAGTPPTRVHPLGADHTPLGAQSPPGQSCEGRAVRLRPRWRLVWLWPPRRCF